MTRAPELLAWLDLEQIDRDIFRGYAGAWPTAQTNLFGGLVAGQALMAAALTVPDGRSPHSLHGYFLRRGEKSQPIIYRVDRDRDGRSFSARRVAAQQGGEVIWDMACSFTDPVDGAEYVQPMATDVLSPDRCPLVRQQQHPLLEIRLATSDPDAAEPVMPLDRAWIRVVVDPGDDPLVHTCLHTYASDVTTGFDSLRIEGVPAAGSSIDHALWFYGAGRADDWILYDCAPARVGGHRGLYTGTAHGVGGDLVAHLAQEMLLRPLRA